MVVLEKITAPASRSRAAGGASASAATSLVVAAPSGTGTPLVAMLSLTVTGTPSGGPIGSPLRQRSVEALAAARALSGSNAYSALMWGSHTATCASTSSSTSAGENCFARKPAIRPTALRSRSGDPASDEAVSRMTACRQSSFDDAREHAGADRQDLVVEREARIMHRHRAVMAEPEIGAGHGMQHVGEILTPHLWLCAREDFCGIDDRSRHFLDHPGMFFLVHQHTEDVTDIDIDFDLEGARDAGADRAHPLADRPAHLVGKRPHRSGKFCFARDHVIGGARVNLRDRHHGCF